MIGQRLGRRALGFTGGTADLISLRFRSAIGILSPRRVRSAARPDRCKPLSGVFVAMRTDEPEVRDRCGYDEGNGEDSANEHANNHRE